MAAGGRGGGEGAAARDERGVTINLVLGLLSCWMLGLHLPLLFCTFAVMKRKWILKQGYPKNIRKRNNEPDNRTEEPVHRIR